MASTGETADSSKAPDGDRETDESDAHDEPESASTGNGATRDEKSSAAPHVVSDDGVRRPAWLDFKARLPRALRALLRAESLFLASWLLLNLMFNVRAPLREPTLWYLLPSVDVVVLLGLLALAGAFKVRVHRVALGVITAIVIFARVYRLADGIVGRMYNRDVNAFVDVPMLPEVARLMAGTLKVWQLVLGVALVLAALSLLVWVNYHALRYAANQLRARRIRRLFVGVVAPFAVVSLFPLRMSRPELFDGVFAASLVPRLRADYLAYQRSSAFVAGIVDKVRDNRKLMRSGAWNLRGLHGANVYLLFFESYGETLVQRDVYRPGVFKEYARIERVLGNKGFNIASTIYDSPTVGGYSWLAHATMATGIKVTDQKQFLALRRARPATMVRAFRNAGYQTTTMNPATMRPPEGPDLYGFETHFYSWEFGYRGVNFSWAPMPDQFALDFVRRHHIQDLDRPLFLVYEMVSSHVPWNDQAPLIADWDQIGDGSIYRRLPHVTYPTTWDNLEQKAAGPYLRSVIYVLEVLLRYINAYVHDDSLFIIVGDHQPVGEVTAHTESRGAIMHVISRNQAFTDKFVRRGFARGMRPRSPTPRLGMEDFLTAFMEDFSLKD